MPLQRAALSTISAVIASGVHLFPFRTEKLSPTAPMVLGAQAPGRVGRRRITSGGPRERPSFCFPPRMRARWSCGRRTRRCEDELVELRPWLRRDIPAIVAACNDPETARWTTVPVAVLRGGRARLARALRDRLDEGAAPLAVVERASGELAAAITLWLHGRVGELGYWAAPESGAAATCPRAVQLLCAWAFDELELPRMQLGTFPGNTASERVAEKCGFTARASCAPGWSSAASAAT